MQDSCFPRWPHVMQRLLPRAMATPLRYTVPIPRNGVDYRGKVVLAPMVRSGELPSRLMALKYGADLVWGPETIDRAMIGTTTRTNPRSSMIEFTRLSSNGMKKQEDHTEDDDFSPGKESVIYRLDPKLERKRLIFQIGTANPRYAVQAAHLVAPYVAGIDVNAGCPKPFSTSGGMGAALLSTPDLLCSILRALVEEIGKQYEIGISVKIRILPEPENTKELVQKLCETGITGLTVHCRTRAMRKGQRAIREQLRMVGEICSEAGVACLMNGDVEDRMQAEALAEEFGVDGGMIATAAEKNPSVFRSAEKGGIAAPMEVVEHYMGAAIEVENRWGNTKFLLAQMIPGKEQQRIGLASARNYEHVCEILGFDHLLERARQLDERLGMVGRETKSEQKAKRRADVQSMQCKQTKKEPKQVDQQAPHGQQTDAPGDFAMLDLHRDIIALHAIQA